MPMLQNMRKFSFVLIVAILSCACSVFCSSAASEPTVVVEQLIADGNIIGYQMVQPIKGEKSDSILLSMLDGPIALIQCGDDRVVYLDSKGMIKEFSVSNKNTIDLWSTDINPIAEDLTGRFVFSNDGQVIYVGINTHPAEVEVNESNYVLKKFTREGNDRVLVSRSGKIYALWQPDGNIVELVTNEGLIRVDLQTGEVVPIRLIDPGKLSGLTLFKEGYGFFIDSRGYIEVRQGLLGSSLIRRNYDDGFELAVDISSRSNAFLAIKTRSEPNIGHQLVETNLQTGHMHVVFEGESISTACYLREN
jgi:hypothetical protein